MALRTVSTWVGLVFLAIVFASGCSTRAGGGSGGSGDDDGPSGVDNPRPGDAPDFVIFSFSGHCFPSSSCGGSDRNPEYLEDRGTQAAIINTIEFHGYSSLVLSYADEFYNRAPNGDWLTPSMDGDVEDYGFLQAMWEMPWVRDSWIADFDNPTRVIVLAHSHGTVWAHSALFLLPDLPVDILIDLDGVSLGWESDTWTFGIGDDWRSIIESYNDANGITWSYDFWNAADNWVVPGLPPQDVEDIAPDSAWLDIEVLARSTLSMPNDDFSNHRLDGSTASIWSYQSVEDHAGVDDPDSDAMLWVAAQLDDLYTW